MNFPPFYLRFFVKQCQHDNCYISVLIRRAVLRPEVLPRDRDLRQGTEGRTGEKKNKKTRFPTHLTINFEFQQEAKRKEAQRLEDENFGTHLAGRIRTFMWNLMEYPETSKYAQVGCMGNVFVGNARVRYVQM